MTSRADIIKKCKVLHTLHREFGVTLFDPKKTQQIVQKGLSKSHNFMHKLLLPPKFRFIERNKEKTVKEP